MGEIKSGAANSAGEPDPLYAQKVGGMVKLKKGNLVNAAKGQLDVPKYPTIKRLPKKGK